MCTSPTGTCHYRQRLEEATPFLGRLVRLAPRPPTLPRSLTSLWRDAIARAEAKEAESGLSKAAVHAARQWVRRAEDSVKLQLSSLESLEESSQAPSPKYAPVQPVGRATFEEVSPGRGTSGSDCIGMSMRLSLPPSIAARPALGPGQRKLAERSSTGRGSIESPRELMTTNL